MRAGRNSARVRAALRVTIAGVAIGGLAIGAAACSSGSKAATVTTVAATTAVTTASTTAVTTASTPASAPTPSTVQAPTPTSTSTGALPVTAAVAVDVVDFAFKPSTLTVKVGTVATWTNGDAFSHSIRSKDGAFDEQTMAAGAKATVTFTKAGTYAYICGIHNSMTGTVVVET